MQREAKELRTARPKDNGVTYFVVEHVNVMFPFRPFAQQKDYIRSLIVAFKAGSNALMEAPTGFGKTLCILSAYVGFKKQFDRALIFIHYAHENQANQRLGPFLHEVEQNFNWTIAEIQDLLSFIAETTQLQNYWNADNGGIQRPLSDDYRAPQLCFCSRTHEQLRQAAEVASKYFYDITTTYLASRDKLCANQDAKKRSKINKVSLNTICKMLSRNRKCPYSSVEYTAPITGDLEDIQDNLQKQSKCPYHAMRAAADHADIIFTPYIYIVDPDMRGEDIEKVLNDAIIIFDEGHQIVETMKDVFSCNFTQYDLDEAIISIRLAMQIYQERITQKSSLQQLASPESQERGGTKKQIEVERLRSKVNDLDFCLSVYKQFHINLQRLRKIISCLSKDSKLRIFPMEMVFEGINRGFTDEQRTALEQVDYTVYQGKQDAQTSRGTGRYLDPYALRQATQGHVEKVMPAIKLLNFTLSSVRSYDQFEMLHTETLDDDGNITGHEYFLACFSARVAMSSLLLQNPRSLVITSGTLSPLRFVAAQLYTNFAIQESFEHFFDLRKQLKAAIIVGRDQKSEPFIGTFQNRRKEYFDSVSLCISELIAQVPEVGVLVFLNSYQLLQKFKYPLKQMFERNPKNRSAGIIFEDDVEALSAYKKYVSEGRKTVLVAVQRGKLSEGIDFSDDLCRAVFIVSIPFPSIQSVVMQRQMEYLNRENGGISGKEYYINHAFQAVNQAIGRVIRHSMDYGQVYLIDERYRDNVMHLPWWFQKVVKINYLDELQNEQVWFKSRQTVSVASPKSVSVSESSQEEFIDTELPFLQTPKPQNVQKVVEISTRDLVQKVMQFYKATAEEKAQKTAKSIRWMEENSLLIKHDGIIKLGKPMLQAAQLASLVKQIRQLKDCEHIPTIVGGFSQEVAMDALGRL